MHDTPKYQKSRVVDLEVRSIIPPASSGTGKVEIEKEGARYVVNTGYAIPDGLLVYEGLKGKVRQDRGTNLSFQMESRNGHLVVIVGSGFLSTLSKNEGVDIRRRLKRYVGTKIHDLASDILKDVSSIASFLMMYRVMSDRKLMRSFTKLGRSFDKEDQHYEVSSALGWMVRGLSNVGDELTGKRSN